MDYLNAVEETIVAEGLAGKVIMIYGDNNVGKSKQSAKFPKSITLPLEPNALNATNGRKLPVYDWASFRDFVDSVYKDKISYDKDLAKLQTALGKERPDDKEESESYDERIARLQEKVDNSKYMQFRGIADTLIIDTLTALGKSCEKFVTDEAEVQELGDIGHGKLYKRFENEYYHTINKFFNLGDFTYVIIAHKDYVHREGRYDEDGEPIMQAYPKGDYKRVVKPVVDRTDIVVYLKSNGTDENHRVIPSSAILGDCDLCFARSKWDNMDLYIQEFSAKNLEEVINRAIQGQKDGGMRVGTVQEQQKTLIENLKVDHKDLINDIGELVIKIYEHDDKDREGVNMLKYQSIVEEFLGDRPVSEATEKHVGQLKNILSRTQDLVEDLV